jgi:hypothetical protein
MHVLCDLYGANEISLPKLQWQSCFAANAHKESDHRRFGSGQEEGSWRQIRGGEDEAENQHGYNGSWLSIRVSLWPKTQLFAPKAQVFNSLTTSSPRPKLMRL